MASTADEKTGHPIEKPLSKELGQSIAIVSYTPEEKRRVVRKIDCVVLPMMCLVFFFQYLDKQSLSYASVFGLITDLNMTSSQYSWCSSIFYIGQLVSEYPFIYLMSKLRLTKFVGVTIIIWGGICMCLAAPKNFSGFATVRFLLGFSEGAVSPAFVTITSYWYKQDEHTIRTALWISMNALAQIIGSLLMYGIGQTTSLPLAPWRLLFLICGLLTTLSGILFYTLMPTGPTDAWFLSVREREILRLRMANANEGGDKTSFSIAQLKEALLDVKVVLIFWFGVLVTMQSPVLTFASLMIKSLGYTSSKTLLYTSPSGAIQLSLILLAVLLTTLAPKNRSLIALLLCIPPLTGCILLLTLPPTSAWAIVVSSWLASCITAPWSILLSLSASNIKGNTKRSVTNAVFFIGYCAGCIASPQLWTHSPRYFSGVVTAIVTWVMLAVAIVAWWVVCKRDNRVRDEMVGRGEVDEGIGGELGEEIDLTDKQDRAFRYTW